MTRILKSSDISTVARVQLNIQISSMVARVKLSSFTENFSIVAFDQVNQQYLRFV